MVCLLLSVALGFLLVGSGAYAQSERVVDIPTRPNVTQRFLFSSPANAKAAVILIAGGHGGLQIFPGGKISWGANNFVVRNRRLFADSGLMVATIDAPSDRQSNPYLSGFRQRPDHVADVKAIIAWVKQQANIPVWLVVRVVEPSPPRILASSLLVPRVGRMGWC